MKNFKSFLTAPWGTDLSLLVLRLVAGGMIFSHGLAKIQNFSAMSASFPDPIGVGSTWSLILIIAAEAGCSILLILGLLTRLAALPLIFGMGMAAFVIHAPFTFSGSELPLVYLLIFVVLLLSGAGKYSLDACLLGACDCRNKKY